MIGLCFPETDIEDDYPHVTFMTSKHWKQVHSNAVLQSTCGKGGIFEALYNDLYNRVARV